jgi:hypothetical protein
MDAHLKEIVWKIAYSSYIGLRDEWFDPKKIISSRPK